MQQSLQLLPATTINQKVLPPSFIVDFDCWLHSVKGLERPEERKMMPQEESHLGSREKIG